MSDMPDPAPETRKTSNSRHLTPAQRRFLKALELDCDPTSASLRVLGKLSPTHLASWLDHVEFRRRLELLLDMVARKRRMTLQIASGRAAERLDASIEDESLLNSEQRRTCVELLKLVEGGRAGPATGAQVLPARTAESAESAAPREISSEPDLAHPDVPRRASW